MKWCLMLQTRQMNQNLKMNKIYLEISKLSDKFREMSYGLCQDKEKINDAVQELMLYFMQMNPETLKGIWE